MIYSEQEIQSLKKSAFNYALYSTENMEVANDISSEALALFILSADKISEPAGWVLNTTKNYCKKYFDSSKRNQNIEKNYRNEIFNSMGERPKLESDEELRRAFKKSFEVLSQNELKTIMFYFQCNESIKLLHENIGGSYQALRAKISRIKRTLKAETYKRLGYYGSKKIVTPQLDNQIVKFLKRFKNNLEAGTLEKMYYYFSEVDLSNYKKDIHIKEILEYEIELVNSIYKAWIIYHDYSDVIQAFIIKFRINEKNMLKILSPPAPSKKAISIDIDSDMGTILTELLEKYPPDKSGQQTIPAEMIEKLLDIKS